MIGERVGGFVILGLLGRGATGTVWLAEDEAGDGDRPARRVALKVLTGPVAEHSDALARFRREVDALSRLRHPRVVAAVDAPGEHEGRLFLPIEYVPGRSLAELVRERGPLPPRAATRVLGDVLDGLAAAHAAGMVHRDLKPSNVLVDRDGRARITDLGLVRLLDATATGPTRAGDVLGTPAFMAPEQARGEVDVGPAADLYAVGGLAFWALAGRSPFRGGDALALLRQHIEDAPPELGSLVAGVSAELSEWVRRALAKAPADRFADAEAMGAALGRIEADLPEDEAAAETEVRRRLTEPPAEQPLPTVERPPTPAPGRPRRAGLLGPLVTVVAIPMIGIFALTFRGTGPATPSEMPPPVEIELDGGEVVAGALIGIADGIARVRLPDGEVRSVRLDRAVELRHPLAGTGGG